MTINRPDPFGFGLPKAAQAKGRNRAIHAKPGEKIKATELEGWSTLDTEAVKQIHTNADTDKSPKALHHTLGEEVNQAASGAELKKAKQKISALESDVAYLRKAAPPVGSMVLAFDNPNDAYGGLWYRCIGGSLPPGNVKPKEGPWAQYFAVAGNLNIPNLSTVVPSGVGIPSLAYYVRVK